MSLKPAACEISILVSIFAEFMLFNRVQITLIENYRAQCVFLGGGVHSRFYVDLMCSPGNRHRLRIQMVNNLCSGW